MIREILSGVVWIAGLVVLGAVVLATAPGLVGLFLAIALFGLAAEILGR